MRVHQSVPSCITCAGNYTLALDQERFSESRVSCPSDNIPDGTKRKRQAVTRGYKTKALKGYPELNCLKNVMGHFRVLLYLCFKTSLSAKSFIWKWVVHAVNFHANQSHFHKNGFRLALKQRHKGIWKWLIQWPISSMTCACRESW